MISHINLFFDEIDLTLEQIQNKFNPFITLKEYSNFFPQLNMYGS